ncbi:hypothetical protein niasHT_006235 [Heterodera trifolii]|uniref:Uncharacterized protein n=1 Tax=Heterodera trifolii TaxID=157864 RepID=A0ABD2M156_9BILA
MNTDNVHAWGREKNSGPRELGCGTGADEQSETVFVDPNGISGRNNSVRATVTHLLAIQQQQKQKQQQNNGWFCIAEQQMQIGTNGSESAEESGASDGENGRGEKRREEEEEKHQGNVSKWEEAAPNNSTLFSANYLGTFKSLRSTHSMGTAPPSMCSVVAASTPTAQQTNKPLPVIKPPGDEKEERPLTQLQGPDHRGHRKQSRTTPQTQRNLSGDQITSTRVTNVGPDSVGLAELNSAQSEPSRLFFLKLPLKQTSANGVVGHFWTVVTRGPDEKPLGPHRAPNPRQRRCQKGNDGLDGIQWVDKMAALLQIRLLASNTAQSKG